MAIARVVAQAKINLFLRVLARESSGFHQLETLFCRLALGDEVAVRLTSGARSLECRGDVIPEGGLGPVEQNLAWRAATALIEATGWATGFAIEIEKKIPVGGGLGGGSADAGAVLRALNALAPNPLSRHALVRLAASLGADVPFLTQDDSPMALAWGRGDRLMPLRALPARPCLLVTFAEGVPTADAYRWLAESPAALAGPVVYSPEQFADWSSVELLAYNEFERVVAAHRPVIAGILQGLREPELRPALPVVLMSGSGATIFALQGSSNAPGGDSLVSIAFGIDPSLPEARSIQLVDTGTAEHVEPVVLGD